MSNKLEFCLLVLISLLWFYSWERYLYLVEGDTYINVFYSSEEFSFLAMLSLVLLLKEAVLL